MQSLKEEKIPVVVTLQVSADTAQALRKSGSSSGLLKIAHDHGVKLEPLHPNAVDPQLRGFFIVTIPNVADAETIVGKLNQCQGVEAAYVKPPDELP